MLLMCILAAALNEIFCLGLVNSSNASILMR